MPRQYSNGGRGSRRPPDSETFGPSTPSRSLKERVGALKNLRPFLTMVWRTSPQLRAASLVLRLIRAVMPVVTLFVGKLIIDNVVALGRSQPTSPQGRASGPATCISFALRHVSNLGRQTAAGSFGGADPKAAFTVVDGASVHGKLKFGNRMLWNTDRPSIGRSQAWHQTDAGPRAAAYGDWHRCRAIGRRDHSCAQSAQTIAT